MTGDPARKVIPVLISRLALSRAVASQDQDMRCQYPGQVTRVSRNFPGWNGFRDLVLACGMEWIIREVNDASQEKGQDFLFSWYGPGSAVRMSFPTRFTQIYILLIIGFSIGPPKMHRQFLIGLPKIHGLFCFGPPKIHRRIGIGPPQVI